MALGFGALALSPQSFWSMTLKELDAAVRYRLGPSRDAPPTRSALDHLMMQFPDTPESAE